ncbi:MAG: lamin tail domain-containing protein, partial [Planctomycetota bacterium]|nr:lamin tail domain-containing protein [Planctomycetota bacterium]
MRHIFVLMLMALAIPGIRAQFVITEFMASCRSALEDEDGYSADWVELHNPSNQAQSTQGWSLGNGKGRRWPLPATEIAPQAYLLVFLSGKDRRDPDQPLHANFRLSRGGGRLQLFADEELRIDLPFDLQYSDTSQGFAQPSTKITLVPSNAVARFFLPGRSTIGKWQAPLFDDEKWQQGPGGFGFDKRPDTPLASRITTDLGDNMRGFSTNACFRMPFEAGAAMLAPTAFLRIECVGGFIAWLNGREIARHNLPDDLLPGSKALLPADRVPRLESYTCAIDDWQQLLRSGRNVLSIRSFSHSPNALEHLLLAELSAWLPGEAQLDSLLFLGEPSPGWPNGAGFADVSEPPLLTVSRAVDYEPGRFIL